MSKHDHDYRPRVGDPVRLKDSDMDLRGDVWQLRTGAYVVVRWQDECRSTHAATSIEYDSSRARAEWSRNLTGEDRERERALRAAKAG
jgi:hypothetical protein